MIAYEDFGDHVDAHMMYLRGTSTKEAFEILQRRLDDRSWQLAPEAWINAARFMGERAAKVDEAAVVAVLDRFVAMLCEGPINEAAHRALANLVMWKHVTSEHLHQLTQWMCRRATPSEASLAGDVLWHVLAGNDGSRHRAVLPLVAWLIENGAAELRSRRRGFLVYDMVRVLLDQSDLDLLAAAVRYVFANEQPPLAYRSDSKREGIDIPLDAIERLLVAGRVPPSFVVDLARAIPEAWLFQQIVHADRPWIERPALRNAVIDALLAGQLSDAIARDAWTRVFSVAPPPGVRFASPEVVEVAAHAVWRRSMERLDTPQGEHDREWARHIVLAQIRAAHARGGFDESTVSAIRRLVSGADALSAGVERALVDFFDEAPPSLYVVSRRILAEPPSEQTRSRGRVHAALLLLVGPEPVPAEHDAGPWIDDVRRLTERVLERVPDESSLGRLLARRRKVTFAALANDAKVQLADELVIADPGEMERLSRGPFTRDESVMIGALYVVHEIVHLIQGIADKSDVGRLRATGGESTLMQLDLAADHLAARLMAPVVDISMTALKDLQGRALAGFPVGATNSTASKARKANRLVGLRLDSFLRAQGKIPADTDEHVFAELGPVGPWLVMLASGPPVRVLGIVSVARSHAEKLAACADPTASRAELDDVLRACDRASSLDSAEPTDP